jgi:hypothetical protein
MGLFSSITYILGVHPHLQTWVHDTYRLWFLTPTHPPTHPPKPTHPNPPNPTQLNPTTTQCSPSLRFPSKSRILSIMILSHAPSDVPLNTATWVYSDDNRARGSFMAVFFFFSFLKWIFLCTELANNLRRKLPTTTTTTTEFLVQ